MEKMKRYVVFFVGLFINSLGVRGKFRLST